jgi:hypothetical protein
VTCVLAQEANLDVTTKNEPQESRNNRLTHKHSTVVKGVGVVSWLWRVEMLMLFYCVITCMLQTNMQCVFVFFFAFCGLLAVVLCLCVKWWVVSHM